MTIYRTIAEANKYDLYQDSAQFSYGNVDYQSFSKEFEKLDDKSISTSNPLAKVVLAIARIVPIIFHTLLCPFLGLNGLKGQIFTAIRELEEVGGSIVYKFNQAKGAYLVQEAQFHLACYSEHVQAIAKLDEIMISFPFNKLQDLTFVEALRVKEHIPFLTRFIKRTDEVIPYDLFNCKLSDFSYANGHDIALNFTDDNYVLFSHLTSAQRDQIDFTRIDEKIINSLFLGHSDRLNQLTPEQIAAVLNVDDSLGRYLDDIEKVKKVDLKALNAKALISLINNPLFKDLFTKEAVELFSYDLIKNYVYIRNKEVAALLVEKINKEGFVHYDDKDLALIFENIELFYDVDIKLFQPILKRAFCLIPYNILKELDLSEVPFDEFIKDPRKFNLIPLALLQRNMNRMFDVLWEKVPEDKIAKLNFDNALTSTIEALPKRLVPLPLIQKHIEELSHQFWTQLPQDIMEKIDFSKVSRKVIERIPLCKMPVSIIQANITSISDEVWEQFPPGRITLLDFTKLSEGEFCGIPPYAFKFIPETQINAIVNKLSLTRLGWLTPLHIASLDFDLLSDDKVKAIFQYRFRDADIYKAIPTKYLQRLYPNLTGSGAIVHLSKDRIQSMLTPSMPATLLDKIIYYSGWGIFRDTDDINDYAYKAGDRVSYMPINFVAKLDLTKLSPQQLAKLPRNVE